MLFKWVLAFRKPSNRLWVIPTYWALMTVIFLFSLRFIVEEMFNENILPDISEDTLDWLLDVISSSMLAVSTFSLSIMVSAFSAAANSATPRALDLVMDDKNTRTAISSFICSFIYAIIAKIALGMGFYGQNSRFILFISTIAVLVYLIITLIAWVYTLSLLGRLGNTLNKIENAAQTALNNYKKSPFLGANKATEIVENMVGIQAKCTGYLTHIDMKGLQHFAEEHNCFLIIQVRPGELISPDTILCYTDQKMENEDLIMQSFVFARARTFAQDPAWGFIVLSEAAQRALSPAVNDPGTAINVMTMMMSLLVKAEQIETDDKHIYDRLYIKALDSSEFIRDGFAPISRDGAAILEVNLVMQKVLANIWRNISNKEIANSAFAMASQSLERAKLELAFDPEKRLLDEKHHRLFKR